MEVPGARSEGFARGEGARDMSVRDRALVEWVAQASIGDAIPEPWSYASRPLESVVRTLVALKVIEKPAPDADLATIAREASAAARRWLEEHP